MPPKKKKGKKKKKDDAELALDAKLKRTNEEIDYLKDHLASRREFSRRYAQRSEDWKQRSQLIEEKCEAQDQLQRDVTANLSRQYKSMQDEMSSVVYELEEQNQHLQTSLDQTLTMLHDERNRHADTLTTKNAEIQRLNDKISTIELEYESVLHDAFDSLLARMRHSQHSWEKLSTRLQLENKTNLLEIGLNPLEI